MSSPVWQKKAGKNPKGGLSEAGRRSARAQGMNLQRPVRGAPKTISEMRRKGSYLSRASGSPGPERDPKTGEATRLLLAIRAWGGTSKADAKKKGKYWLDRYHSAKDKKK